MRNNLRLLLPVALAVTFITFGATARADNAANDCLIGVLNAAGQQLSGKVTCTDCDPTCDADGQATANGSCTFKIQGCIDIVSAGCQQRPLKKVKFKTPHANNTIVVTPVSPTSTD